MKRITMLLSWWYVPLSGLRLGDGDESECCHHVSTTYHPWYTDRFKGIGEATNYIRANLDRLREASSLFRDTLQESTLPPEVIEAVGANLGILKSPTILRQADGRLWCWESCSDGKGSCAGSCTHVWNYAQALPHLFSGLERTLRHTEFNECQSLVGLSLQSEA